METQVLSFPPRAYNIVGGDRKGRRLPKKLTSKLGLEESNIEGRGLFQAKGKSVLSHRAQGDKAGLVTAVKFNVAESWAL